MAISILHLDVVYQELLLLLRLWPPSVIGIGIQQVVQLDHMVLSFRTVVAIAFPSRFLSHTVHHHLVLLLLLANQKV